MIHRESMGSISGVAYSNLIFGLSSVFVMALASLADYFTE
jgi:hypothetical protein